MEMQEILIPLQSVELRGDFQLVEGNGLVIFAHGSGSGRKSPRNRYVASSLNAAGLSTLLFDLLTEKEESIDNYSGQLRFNIDFLANRLAGVTQWVHKQPWYKGLNAGFFGASTGAAAAIVAAAKLGNAISAIVSRGGRPDLAGDYLSKITAPTLLIVGGNDYEVIRLNRDALLKIKADREMKIIPGATHLFEESGALEMVAGMAKDWFYKYLALSGNQ